MRRCSSAADCPFGSWWPQWGRSRAESARGENRKLPRVLASAARQNHHRQYSAASLNCRRNNGGSAMKLNGEMLGRDWATLLWAVGLICVTLLMLTWSISPWSQWDWAGQTAAAWVQAVGSVVAIGIAIAVPAVQHRADSRRKALHDRQDAGRLLGIAAQLATSCLATMVAIYQARRNVDHQESQEERRIQYQAITDVLACLEGIPMERMPSAGAARRLLGLRFAIRSASDIIEHERPDWLPGGLERSTPWAEIIGMTQEIISAIMEEVQSLGVNLAFGSEDLLEAAEAIVQEHPSLANRIAASRRAAATRNVPLF